MKTTKKRLVLGIAGAVLLCVGATFTTLAATAEAPITDETMLANIEALSQEETPVRIPCMEFLGVICKFKAIDAQGIIRDVEISDNMYMPV